MIVDKGLGSHPVALPGRHHGAGSGQQGTLDAERTEWPRHGLVLGLTCQWNPPARNYCASSLGNPKFDRSDYEIDATVTSERPRKSADVNNMPGTLDQTNCQKYLHFHVYGLADYLLVDSLESPQSPEGKLAIRARLFWILPTSMCGCTDSPTTS